MRRFTPEEIKKIAPGYRGKPERFDPAKVGKKNEGAKTGKKSGLSSKEVTPPKAKTPTAPKNASIWADSVFGIDVAIRELHVNQKLQDISPTFGRLPDLVEEVYASIGGDDKNLYKQMTKGMLMYYSTAMLWARLLDIKAKRGNTNMTFEEFEFCNSIMQHEYNIPEPICLFLKGIGDFKDVTGKTVKLVNHTLPVTIVQGRGGYHSAVIDVESHNLYEEVPSLGICGDILMAEASQAANPTPNFRVLPQNTRATRALAGYFGAIGTREEKLRLELESFGITATDFKEQIAGTSLNIRLIQKVSDYFARSPTFRKEKVKLDALTADGDSVQLIKSIPTDENVNPNVTWTNLIVRPTAATAIPTTVFGASYIMGYQLTKGPVANSNANWCCVEQANPAQPWVIPQEWVANRNARRVTPEELDIARFVAISDSQRNRTNSIVRSMIISQR